MTVKRATRNNADQFITARQDFKTSGSLSGYNIGSDPYNGTYGRLPDEYRESCRWADYRVYSYATPIAWWSEENGWTRPEVSYSPTTSHHQGKCPRSTSDKVLELARWVEDTDVSTPDNP
jgi:hypothetical protein